MNLIARKPRSKPCVNVGGKFNVVGLTRNEIVDKISMMRSEALPVL
jgi:hypothetical protein